jgi:hypothetical protein
MRARRRSAGNRGAAARRRRGVQAFAASARALGLFVIAMGEMLPRADNRLTLDPNLKDAWGIPALHIDVTYGRTKSR